MELGLELGLQAKLRVRVTGAHDDEGL